VDEKMCKDVDQVGLSLLEYVDLYHELKGMVGERDVAMAILRELAADTRESQARRLKREQEQGPATDRQKAYLKALRVEFGPGITYGQAQELIDRQLARGAELPPAMDRK
jgi:hypothetical protein